MSSAGIPPDVRRFLDRHIDSAVQVELLLLLRGRAGRCSIDEIARELRIDPHHARDQVAGLRTSGVVAEQDGKFTYAPADAAIAAAVDHLAAAYETHRVAITSAIYSKPSGPIRSFSDAFRIRKDRDDG